MPTDSPDPRHVAGPSGAAPGPARARQPEAGGPTVVPVGYRQGIITAISLLLGFSLAFGRFWGLESPGQWNAGSILVAISLIAAVSLQIVSLFRALRIEDDQVSEYRVTVRWIEASSIAMLVSLVGAVLEQALISGK